MKRIIIIAAAILSAATASAQEWGYSVGADLMSVYNWRGIRQAEKRFSPTILPSVTVGYYGGTVEFEACPYYIYEFDKNGYRELGVELSASAYNFTAGLKFYNLESIGKGGDDRFDVYEASLGYTFPVSDKFNPSLTWNTVFAGVGDKADKSNFSSYIELSMPYSVSEDLEIAAILAAHPFKAPYMCHYENGFKFATAGASATYTFSLGENFSLPVTLEAGYNCPVKDWYYGLTLGFYFEK